MEFLDAFEKSNRAAVLLAVQRYDLQVKPFVKDSFARFAYVESRGDINRIINEVCEELQADPSYVESRFREIVARPAAPDLADFSPIGEKDPAKHEELGYKSQGDGLPPEKYQKEEEKAEGTETTDVLDHDAVLDESEPTGRLDLSQHTQSSWKRVERDFLA